MMEDQFNIIQGTVREAENIIQDAVAKLDDPLHIRCTSSPGMVPLNTYLRKQQHSDKPNEYHWVAAINGDLCSRSSKLNSHKNYCSKKSS